MSQALLPLDAALTYAQRRHLPLCYGDRIALWTPHAAPVCIRVHRAIYAHQERLADLMAAGDTTVCPSPRWHRHLWAGGVCYVCRRIEPSIQAAREGNMLPA